MCACEQSRQKLALRVLTLDACQNAEMSALKFTRVQRNSSKTQKEGKAVSSKTTSENTNTTGEAGETAKPTSFCDPTVETPKIVGTRSRPTLPSRVDDENPNAEHGQEDQQQNDETKSSDLDKRVGVLNVSDTTNFVCKVMSVKSSPGAIPTSPTPSRPDLSSPGIRSPNPPESEKPPVTPRRLRSIRVRLENVKEEQDKQAEVKRVLAKYTKHRKTQIISQDEDSFSGLPNFHFHPIEPQVFVLGNLNTVGLDFLGDSSSESSCVRSSIVSPLYDLPYQSQESGKESCNLKSVCDTQNENCSGFEQDHNKNTSISDVAVLSTSESVQSLYSSQENGKKGHSKEVSSVTDKYHKIKEDLTNNNRVSDMTDIKSWEKLNEPVIEASCDEHSMSVVTSTQTCAVTQINTLTLNTDFTSDMNSSSSQYLSANSMRQLSEGPDNVFLSPVSKTAEDEGHMEDSDLNLSSDLDVCSKLSDIPPDSENTELGKGLDGKNSSKLSKIENIPNSESRSETDLGSSMKKGLSVGSETGNASNQNDLCMESSVVEDGEICSLQEQVFSGETCQDCRSTVPKHSQIPCADRQFSHSETCDVVSTDSLELFESKSRRCFKQKSKSDPCGKQRNDLIDIFTVIDAHSKSVPILSSITEECSNISISKKEQTSDNTYTKENDTSSVSLKQRILQKITKTKEVSGQTKENSAGQSNERSNEPHEEPTKSKQQHTDMNEPNTESVKVTETLQPPERHKCQVTLAEIAVLGKQIPKANNLEDSDSENMTNQVQLKDSLSTSLVDKPQSSEKLRLVIESRPDILQSSQVTSGGHQQSVSEKSSPVSENSPSFSPSPLVTSKKKTSVYTTKPSFTKRSESFTISLPSLRKPNITRSHSSASMIQHKLENSKAKVNHADEGDEGVKSRLSVPELTYPPVHRVSTFTPTLEPVSQLSHIDLYDRSSGDKEKRDFIVTELYNTEKEYVHALKMLVEKYMVPLKTLSIIDSNIVDDIFYKINEINVHHAMFLSFLHLVLQNWDSTKTVGDIIYKTFSKQTVIESYVSFIINFPKAEKVLDTISSKSSFQKFVEQIEQETRSKLPLKAQLVKPAQRIPRYELLLKRLLDNTSEDHPDYQLLKQAEAAIHQLALNINSIKAAKKEDVFQNTLKKLELLLLTELVSPERLFLRHEQVQVLDHKDHCCIWLFSDLLVFTSIKRKSGPVSRKSSLLLHSPIGNDYVENFKQKLWLRVPLEKVEIKECTEAVAKCPTKSKEELEKDFTTLSQIADTVAKLHCAHQNLDDNICELLTEINRKLSESQLKPLPPDATSANILATMPEGVRNMIVVFATAEKKNAWVTLIEETRNKLLNQLEQQ